MPEPRALHLPMSELASQTGTSMSAVIENGVVRSTIQDLPIPDVDFGTFIRSACRKFKDRTAMIDDATGERCSYQRLEELCCRVAVGLKKLGFRPGDMAGVHSGVNMDLILAFYGTLFAGGSMVFAKSNLSLREVEYQFTDSDPSLIFCDEQNAEKTLKACKALPSVKTLVVIGRRPGMVSFSTLKQSPHAEYHPPEFIDPQDIMAILYSSGTTGHPKGVMVSHQNFLAQVLISGDGGARLLEKDDVMLGTAPFTHVSGLWLCSTSFSVGATFVILAKNEPEDVLPAIEKYKATQMVQFPTSAQKFVQCPLVDKYDLSSLKKLIIGGSTTPTMVARGIIDKLKLKSFRHVYGMSETSGAVTVTPDSIENYESVGTPCALTQIKVVDVITGQKLGVHQQGEICVKGIHCVRGYYNKPEATAKLYDDEGFLKTGDIGYYTKDGLFYIVDRIKELIKCMDQQVAPAELEDLLLRHEAVKEVVVTGVPHPEFGEAARAYVVLFQGFSESKALGETLKKLVADQSAPHKQLHGGIEFVSSIPKSDTGKNLRRALRDSYMKHVVPVGK